MMAEPKLPAAIRSVGIRKTIMVRNNQRAQALDLRLLKRLATVLLGDLLQKPVSELAIYVLAASEMTRLNETFLQHRGSTAVITFDYANDALPQLGCDQQHNPHT